MESSHEDWRTHLRFSVPTGDAERQRIQEVVLKVYFYGEVSEETTSPDILQEVSNETWDVLHTHVGTAVVALSLYNKLPELLIIPVTFIKAGIQGGWYPLVLTDPGSDTVTAMLNRIAVIQEELAQSFAEFEIISVYPHHFNGVDYTEFDDPAAMQQIFELAMKRGVQFNDADGIAAIMAELNYFHAPCCKDSECPFVQSLERHWRGLGFVPGAFIAG